MPEIFFTYVLYSRKFDKIYIGFTSDLNARFISHNVLAKKGWTMRYRPWEMLYYEQYTTKKEAMKREKELKSAKGRVFIYTQLLNIQ